LKVTPNCLVEESALDDELKWMLPWYFSISDFYLTTHEGLHALKDFSSSSEGEMWSLPVPTRASLMGRGQMGEYWLSISGPRTAV